MPMNTIFAMVILAAVGGGGTASAPRTSPPSAQLGWDLRWMVESPLEGPVPRPPRVTERSTNLGKSLYAARCAACHGLFGDGKGPEAARLAVPPTNFLLGVYKLRSTPSGSIPTDEDLFRTLTRGVHETPMLPWKELRADERWALVNQLKSFSVRFRQESPSPSVRVPPPPKEDEALRGRGAELYARLRCAACHGEEGAGNGPAATAYRQTTGGRAIRIRDFTRGRFIRGAEMADLFLTLRVGIEGTPMGSYDALADGDLWAIAAYVRSLVQQHPLPQLPPAGNHASLEIRR
jgi:mono/diheme cytochrome c family protein